MSSKFPPGLLNPGSSGASAVGSGDFCMRYLRVECPSGRELIFNLFFTSYGVWMLLPLSLLLLLVYRLVGPPEVDEREEELRQQWAKHRERFKSGAKRSTLRGVIKSSYLSELSGGDGRRRGKRNGAPTAAAAAAAATATASSAAAGGTRAFGGEGPRNAWVASSPPAALRQRDTSSLGPRQDGDLNKDGGDDDDDDSWEDVRRTSSEDAPAAGHAGAPSTALAGPRLPPPRETFRVLTTPGPTRVTIVGDRGGAAPLGTMLGGDATGAVSRSKNIASGGGGGGGNRTMIPVLTLHAAGHNHRTCFAALEREVMNDPELGVGCTGGVVFYHVDTPGHEEEAQDIEDKAFSLEAQAAQLLEVTIQLGLSWFVGFGVGTGANVLLRFSCDNPDRVAGLILANGSAEEAGRRERNTWLAARFRLSWEKDMKAARESLVPLSFSPYSSLGNRYRAALGTMHSGNVLKYVDASLCRDDIPVSRLKALKDVWTLLICGKAPGSASRARYLASWIAGVDAEDSSRTLLDRLRRSAGAGGQASKATLVTLDGGGDGGGVAEAMPREILAAMKLFLHKCY